ncbi:MAG: RibD family protein [Desulfobacterales bacterium]
MQSDKTSDKDPKSKTGDFAKAVNIAENYVETRIQSIEDLKKQLQYAEAFRTRYQRPFIAVSYAQSVDGSIASRNRAQIALSGPKALVLTHQIRACCDSVLIGIGTVLADNPQLTVRMVEGKNPQPIILDTHLRTPLNAKLVQRTDLRIWIINGRNNTDKQKQTFTEAGARPLPCTTGDDGKIDLFALMDLLAKMKINSIMVEGGAQVITSFLNSKLVDQFIITITPKLVGGLQAINSNGLKMSHYLDLDQIRYQHLGNDIIMWARPTWETQ